jgi:hypothetical protein
MTDKDRIPNLVLDLLLDLGRDESENSPFDAGDCLITLAPYDHINRLHGDTWDAVTEGVSIEDLVALVRGLAIAEKQLRWCGGSVSAVIWTFRRLEWRDKARADQLADWILQYSENPYEPYGSDRGSARSVAEVNRQREARLARNEAHTAREKRQKEQAAIRRCDRAVAAEEHSRSQAIHSSERSELLEDLGKADLPAKLRHLVSDTEHPLSWYPKAWAELTDSEVSQLPVVLVDGLKARLADRKRGPWRQLYKQLIGIPKSPLPHSTFSGDSQ